MRRAALGRLGIATGLTVAAAALSLSGAASASAADGGWSPRWYSTYGECQYSGNVLAQLGKLHGFSCLPYDGGYGLYPW
ncbi:hypothetical protein GCM10023195_15640 [Actinoallomurus liliacearum]|uniref:Secreted protein n=1 Tax=Actinoallomurus liliacearum TaxID=1080073 RepID=A0ABP8TGN9_9ACTN